MTFKSYHLIVDHSQQHTNIFYDFHTEVFPVHPFYLIRLLLLGLWHLVLAALFVYLLFLPSSQGLLLNSVQKLQVLNKGLLNR